MALPASLADDLTHQPRRLDWAAWETILADLGFEPWETAEGVSLANVVGKAFREAERSRSPRGFFPSDSTPDARRSRAAFWRHPRGIQVALDGYQDSRGDWALNSVAFLAFKALPAPTPEGKSMLESWPQALPTGDAVARLAWDSQTATDAAQSFPEFWRQAGAARLFPVHRWGEVASQVQTVFAGALRTWVHLSNSWSHLTFRVPDDLSPSSRSSTIARLLAKERGRVGQAMASLHFPPGEEGLRRAWERAFQAATSQGRPLPARELRELRIEQDCRDLAETARTQWSAHPGAPRFLDPTQRQAIDAWVTGLATPGPVRRARGWPQRVEGFPEWDWLDLALDNPFSMNPGRWARILDRLDRLDDEELAALCKPRPPLRPLALALAAAAVSLPAKALFDDTLAESLEGALAGLDRLCNRVGPTALEWEGSLENVWGLALCPHFHLPTSSDLVEKQRPRLQAFLAWAERRGVSLPDTVRWVDPGTQAPLARGLLDEGPDAPEHWGLLGAVRARKAHRRLTQALGPGVEPPALPRRPRM